MSEELTLRLLSALLSFLWLSKGSVSDLIELNSRHIELGGCLDNISTVNSSEGNAVDLVWT